MTKEKFLQQFDELSKLNIPICVSVVNPRMINCEDIIFNPVDFEYKRSYYDNAYNDNMELKTYTNIRIISIK